MLHIIEIILTVTIIQITTIAKIEVILVIIVLIIVATWGEAGCGRHNLPSEHTGGRRSMRRKRLGFKV